MFMINHMKNLHNSTKFSIQALLRNMKSGVQEEPGGQDGHARLGKQALLHQGCSQLHTSRCRAKDVRLKTFMQIARKLFLLQDYTKKFSAVCAGCKKAITPKQGQVVQSYQIKRPNLKRILK